MVNEERLNHIRLITTAHVAVKDAIRRGDLVPQPCEMCGAPKSKIGRNTSAHHDDYTKPLGIRWLCQTCHTNWHYPMAHSI